jgi:hypothetical protein
LVAQNERDGQSHQRISGHCGTNGSRRSTKVRSRDRKHFEHGPAMCPPCLTVFRTRALARKRIFQSRDRMLIEFADAISVAVRTSSMRPIRSLTSSALVSFAYCFQPGLGNPGRNWAPSDNTTIRPQTTLPTFRHSITYATHSSQTPSSPSTLIKMPIGSWPCEN